ncbi:MAG: hypothetical protein AAGI34_00360 [Pseudomonadota bacterium]
MSPTAIPLAPEALRALAAMPRQEASLKALTAAIARSAERRPTPAALGAALDRLVDGGLLQRVFGDTLPGPRRVRERCYAFTEAGRSALAGLGAVGPALS